MNEEITHDQPRARDRKAIAGGPSGSGAIRGVVFDYGCVLSLPLDNGSVARMARLLGIAPDRFMEAYLRPRHRYDLGEIGRQSYWNEVISPFGAPPDDAMVEGLFLEDVSGWMRVRTPMVEWARVLKESGIKLAILSNMPPDHIDYIGVRTDWFSLFDVKVFSAAVRLAKPDPAIYRHCLSELALPAGECLFIDDLAPNVEAARREGLGAVLFESEEKLAAEIGRFRGLPSFPIGDPR